MRKKAFFAVSLFIISFILTACGATATPTSVPATTAPATTVPATTAPAPTTVAPTTVAPAPTTVAPTTVAPRPTTVAAATTTAATTAAPAPTAAPKPATANEAQAASLVKLVDTIDELKVRIDFATEGSTKIEDFRKFMNETLTFAGTAKTNLAAARTTFNSDTAAVSRLNEIDKHLDNLISTGRSTLQEPNLNKAIQDSLPVIVYGKALAYPQTLSLMVDAGVTGTLAGVVTDNSGKPLPDSFVAVYAGPYYWMTKTDAAGNFSISNTPAYGQVEVKSYQLGFIYHEEKVPLQRNTTARVTLRMPPMTRPERAPTATNPTIKADTANPRLLNFTLTATDPQNDVSHQIYALNLALGIAVPLEATGSNNLWAGKYLLPATAAKESEWVFFAVDRMCNQGQFLPVKFTLP